MNSATTTSRRFGARAAFPLLLLTSMLFSAPLLAQGEPELLRKPVGKGAYEMVYSQGENALYLATSQSRKLDKGGVVYRLDPQTLDITQIIHNDIKPFGAAINSKTDTLFFGNTVNNSVTAIDGKTGEVKGRLVLDAAASRLYVTNADGELVTIDTKTNKVLSRKKLDESKEHFFLNISLDPATHRAFITDSKQAEVLVVDTRDGKILSKIDVPESLAVLFNPTRNEVYVTHRQAGQVSVIDAKNYKLLQTIKTPTHPNSLALSPDGQTLYVSVKQASSREKEATAPDDVIRIALK